MKNVDRMLRVQELLRAELAELLREAINNPVITQALVTISRVHCSRDLGRADVFFLCSGEDLDEESVEQALNKSSSFLRSELFKRLEMRKVPELKFHFDKGLSEGAELSMRLAKGHYS